MSLSQSLLNVDLDEQSGAPLEVRPPAPEAPSSRAADQAIAVNAQMQMQKSASVGLRNTLDLERAMLLQRQALVEAIIAQRQSELDDINTSLGMIEANIKVLLSR